jgi:LuxR family transcriptional regulator, maltose regulon positive regulatory protein
MPAPLLAKLSRPRTSGVSPRERLFSRLDECLEHPAAWIAGPPGAGKTTLVASYVDARSLPTLWYQVDAGDHDPATFFYYFGLGAQNAGLSKKTRLPLLTPEYLPDLCGFTRRYFRALFQALSVPRLLIFDNLHEAPETSPLHGLVGTALGEMPAGFNAILISRESPAAAHARLCATRTMAEMGWDELKLNAEEAARMAAAQGIDPDGIDALIQRCDGWAAGLTLLLAQARATGSIADTPESPQALFDYFAAELFDTLPLPAQRVLLSTALLPSMSVPMARALSHCDEAGAILESLHRRHLFTDRTTSSTPSYRYHALFRQFLETRMRATLQEVECLRLQRDSARLLEQAEQAGTALQLYLAAGEHDAAVRLVLGAAPGLAIQGRLQTLSAWIDALPRPLIEALPWLAYWQGICRLGANPAQARDRLEGAFDGFAAANDVAGRALAAAAIIETHMMEWGDFRQTRRWTGELLRLLGLQSAFPDVRIELRALGSLIGAIVTVDPAHPRLADITARTVTLLGGTSDVNARITAACMLLHYYTCFADADAGAKLVAQMRPLLSDAQLLPLHRCHWLHMEATYFQLLRYDGRLGNAAMDAALDIAQANGLGFLALVLRCHAAQFRLEALDSKGAVELLAQVTPALAGSRYDAAVHEGLQSWIALDQGRHVAAVAHARRHVEACMKTGGSHPTMMALLWLANALAASGEAVQAVEMLQRSRQANVVRVPMGEFSADLVEADIRLAGHCVDETEALLRRGLALGRRECLFNTLQWLPRQMSRLCAFALEHDIETGFASQLIRLRRIDPPSPDAVAWPWPLKIRCLGAFEILEDDEPLRFEGKAQRKPLTLLKALVVLGGVNVPEDKLIDIVWAAPFEGDAQKVFDIAVHRLRKLLGNDKALLVGDRRVSLNRELVWVDLLALERLLAAVVPLAPTALPDVAELERAAPMILKLYRGGVLDGEPDAAWLLPTRNRIKGRLQRFVARLAGHYECAGQWARAAELYERGIDIDPLAEGWYAGLMACLREQGRRAEAIEAFRRCSQMLSVTLAIKPGAATEALYRSLLAD